MKPTYLFYLALASLFSLSTTQAQIKVACIGNSITYGAKIENRTQNSYPAQLQKMLGKEWMVKNFGNSGSTLLKKGNKPYWNQKQFTEAQNFHPDVVIFKLGTNDTKPINIVFKDEFINDYIDLITLFKALPSQPKIYVCLPVPAFPGNARITNNVLVSEIIPRIKEVIKKTKVEHINLYQPFVNDASLFPDKIHPNKEGAKKMAEIIFELIKNN